MSQNEKAAKWLIFIIFLILFPSLFYMVMGIGLLPGSYFIYSSFTLIVHLVTSEKTHFDDIVILVILLTHVAIYISFYYWLAKFITSKVFAMQSALTRISVMSGIMVALIVASFLLPIYFVMGEGGIRPTNITGVFETFR